jgi:uncharacterized membrane protein
MTWEQRYELRRTVRTSLVLWTGLAVVAALIVAPAIRWVDRETGWVIFGFSPEGARGVLGVLVGSMLTFIVFVLSATLIVVQLASGQSTPRVIGVVLAMPGVKAALGVLTFAYTYTLSALGRVDDRVPDQHVSVAVFLNLGCILDFLLFVQRLSTGLRPAALIQLVAGHARQVFADVYPVAYDPHRHAAGFENAASEAPGQVVGFAERSGVVMAFGAIELAQLAERADAVIELLPQVGDFVAAGDPLFRVAGRSVSPDRLRGCIAIGPERTLEQEPWFVFRILVDIASKALSPAINDPTTAVQAIDQIQHMLLLLGRRHLDDGRVRDRKGNLLLMYGNPNWADFVMLAVSEVRQFEADSLQFNRRLLAMLQHLLDALPEDRWPSLWEDLGLLGSGVERTYQDEEDRRRAKVADYQGVGAPKS